MNTSDFLDALQAAVAGLRVAVRTEFGALNPAELNHRPAPTGWSILECLEHLNRYSRYYNVAVAQALAESAPGRPGAEVGYSWLGRKSVAMMHPANAKKQRAVQRLNPLGSRLGPEVLAEFDQHQTRLLALLAQARTANLNRSVVPVEFFRLLKLRLGETLEFVVVHQQRHVRQAQRVRATLPSSVAAQALAQPVPSIAADVPAASSEHR